MQEPQQISTELRDKLPRDHLFPLSSKVLSSSLLGVPQYSELLACYKFRDVYWASEYRQKLDDLGSIAVLGARYTNPQPFHSSSNKMIEEGYYEPKWRLNITAVPRKYVRIVKVALIEEALPKVHDWLVQTGLPNDNTTRGISFHFDLKAQELSCYEPAS